MRVALREGAAHDATEIRNDKAIPTLLVNIRSWFEAEMLEPSSHPSEAHTAYHPFLSLPIFRSISSTPLNLSARWFGQLASSLTLSLSLSTSSSACVSSHLPDPPLSLLGRPSQLTLKNWKKFSCCLQRSQTRTRQNSRFQLVGHFCTLPTGG